MCMIKIGMLICDRYEIIEKVGTGGMADVYKAKDHRLNRYVAIKVLKQEYSADTKFVTKFRVEAQSVAGLTHPNIVAVYDVGDEDGLYYIVMELIEGITLKKYIEHKGKLDIKEALGISIQIAQGLSAAHANHIIHRDIKPHNIIISREGKIKVTDFGIAKAASSNTITSNAMGSVHYISPEQARGGFSDEKSDIYSLGITMYEMLSGKVPFTGDSTVSVALSHIQDEAPLLDVVAPQVPSVICRIVEKCMQKKPEMRYLSVESLIMDLKRAVTDPNGDFVKIEPVVVEDAPTIHISDEDLKVIKEGTKTIVVSQDVSEDNLDLSHIDKEPEDEGGEIDPKLEKAVVIGSVAAGIILALIVVFIIFKIFAGGGGDNPGSDPTPTADVTATASPDQSVEGVTLKDLSDMDKQTAMAYINSLNMSLSIETEESESEEIEAGRVISTSPVEGSQIFAGEVITLIISSGPKKVPVPDVTGKTQEEAEDILEEADFTTSVEYDFSDTVEIEKVIRTEPASAEEVEPGSEVKIILSKGKETIFVLVPSLTNMSQKEAKKALKKLDLVLGSVTSGYSDTVPAGCVISQTVSEGTEVETGTSVSVVISMGPEPRYIYTGSVTIYDNPFTAELPSGTVKFVLNQDGTSKVVTEQVMTPENFPFSLSAQGVSESEGEIVMYVNGARFMAYNISFTKIAQ